MELVREACNCTHEEALTLLASTDGNVDEAVHAFVDQEKVEQGVRVRTQKQVARKRARLDHGDNTAGRVMGPPPRRSKRTDRDIRRKDLQWANWQLQTAVSHHDAKFDAHAGQPLKIYAPYVPPGVSWRGVNAVLSHLYVGERDHGWVPAQVQVAAVATSPRTGAALSGDTMTHHTSVANLREVADEAAYFQIFYGKKAAAAVLASGCPRGCIPACAQLKVIDKSLIVFASKTPTFSGTHRDKTSSILHCVCGAKAVFLCPPNVHKKMPDVYMQHPGNEDWLTYDPFDDPQPPPHWQRCDLIPGESVFIPAGWWHNVLSPVDTIGLSVDITSANVGEENEVAAGAVAGSVHA